MPEYKFLDRVLHFAALQVFPIADMSFDLDQRMVKGDWRDVVSERHVFVAGLARAGTTILMRRFHASGAFRSLTYRDMPFVLAPNLWKQLVGLSSKTIEATERAHGDGILVDLDSPESLDEVFWRIFAGDEYIRESHLCPHSPPAEIVNKYVRYVKAILHSSDGRQRRYLSKNNNNILRLKAVRSAFPNAIILIPFRNPTTHAQSLFNQDQKFATTQNTNGFARSYMTWLAHHEFGLDHRPFRFTDGDDTVLQSDRSKLAYWLRVWRDAYRWLESSAPSDAIFVCYEDLCQNMSVWTQLADLAGLDEAASAGESFSLSRTVGSGVIDDNLLREVSEIYDRLRSRARAALG